MVQWSCLITHTIYGAFGYYAATSFIPAHISFIPLIFRSLGGIEHAIKYQTENEELVKSSFNFFDCVTWCLSLSFLVTHVLLRHGWGVREAYIYPILGCISVGGYIAGLKGHEYPTAIVILIASTDLVIVTLNDNAVKDVFALGAAATFIGAYGISLLNHICDFDEEAKDNVVNLILTGYMVLSWYSW